MRAAAFALLLAMAAPFAAAGTAEDPEIVDPPGDTRAGPAVHGDLLAAWLEDGDAEGVTTVLRVASFDPVAARGTDHYFSFRLGNVSYCTFAYVGPRGDVEFVACVFDPRSGFQTGVNTDTTGNVTPGAPGEVRVRFPWAFAQTPPPLVLTDLRAETFDFRRPVPDPERVGNPFFVDGARSDATYALGATVAAEGGGDAAPLARAVPGAGALVGALGAALAGRFTRRP